MASIPEIEQAVRQVLARLPLALLGRCLDRIDSAYTDTRDATHGTSRHEVDQAVDHIARGKQAVHATVRHVVRVEDALERYLEDLVARRSANSTLPEPAIGHLPPPLAPAADQRRVARMRRYRILNTPDAIGDLCGMDDRPVQPGPRGPGGEDARAGIAEPYRAMRFIQRGHVEANATAYMRQHELREAKLYLTMAPCAGSDGCAENIQHTLPVGWMLYIYDVSDASHGSRVIRGTGEGLEQ